MQSYKNNELQPAPFSMEEKSIVKLKRNMQQKQLRELVYSLSTVFATGG